MARLFDDASTEYLHYVGVPVTVEPITMACWGRTDSNALDQTMMALGNDGSQGFYRVYFAGNVASDPVSAQKQMAGGGTSGIAAKIGYSVNTWHHITGLFGSTTSRYVYLDGVPSAQNTTGVPDASVDFTALGVVKRSSLALYLSGSLAWPAIWSAALSAGEIAALAAGAYPPTIRPDSLVAFWPLGGFDTEETDGGGARDLWGIYDLTAVSAAVGPGLADHPGGLIYPSGNVVYPAAAAAATIPHWIFSRSSQVIGGGVA